MATDTIPQTAQVQPEPTLQTATVPPPPANGQALAPAKPVRDRIQVHYDPSDPASLYMDTGIFEQLQRVAQMMAKSSLVPAHLRYLPDDEQAIKEQRIADCFLVTAQAFRWRMDCFAVAQHTFVLKGKLGYEGKLIAAIINASGRIEQNLAYEYSGDPGPGRKVVVSATLKGEKKVRTVEGTVAAWATENDMWRKDQDQILSYRGAREWARRHMPEIILGIAAEEELPAMARSVEMTRTSSGGFAPKADGPRPVDPLLAAIGISPEPQTEKPAEDFVLVEPAKPVAEAKAPLPPPLVDPAVCTHPLLPPSRLKAGKTMCCPDCRTALTGDPVQG